MTSQPFGNSGSWFCGGTLIRTPVGAFVLCDPDAEAEPAPEPDVADPVVVFPDGLAVPAEEPTEVLPADVPDAVAWVGDG